MARRRSSGFPFFLIILLLIGAGIGYVFFFTDLITIPEPSAKKNVVAVQNSSIFDDLETWLPQVVWERPVSASEDVYYGSVKGRKVTGTLVNHEGYVNHFEDPGVLEKLGYKEDLNLSADGPGSSLWGYSKETADGKTQIVTFSYTNEDMHESSEGPLTADCPCTLSISAFISDPFTPNWK